MKLRRRNAALPLVLVALAACTTPTSPPGPHADAGRGQAACAALPGQSKLVATELTTRYVLAGTRRAGGAANGVLLAGHCVVTGRIHPRSGVDGKPYATGFELSLPDEWNGRFLYLGGGGNDGVLRDTSMTSSISIATPSPLSQGFAVVSTDAGHTGQSGAFGVDPRARVDHAFDSHHKTAVWAKALIAQRYGRAPAYSYFSGCSGGGRWALGNSTTDKPDSRYVFLMVDALVNEFFTPPDPGFDYKRFDFDKDPARMSWFSAIYDTYEDAQLAAYRQRGGKLLFIHGMADPIFSAQEMLAYYDQLASYNGGLAATQSFARAFVVPGMNHCSGGPATDSFDSIQAMVDWVEKGKAPDRIAASAAPNQAWFPNRTRPLCPYPSYARYSGSGSIEEAANFVCTQP